MGQHHARVYSELAESELVAVVDSDIDRARFIGDKFDVPAYTDYRLMLQELQPEAVSVAVPTQLHEEVASAAILSGAHVLIEKPLAATIEEGQRLIDLAHRMGRHLMVGHIVRFNPATQMLKKKLLDGELGRIYQIVCRRVGPFPSRISDVGVVVDLASHDVDLMRFLLGADPVHLFAETGQNIHQQHEDLLLGILMFPNGIKGSLEVNWLTPTRIREVLVLGENGMLKVDALTQELSFYQNGHANGNHAEKPQILTGVSEGQIIRYPVEQQEPLKAELAGFINSIITGEPVPVSGEEGLAALRFSLALVESGVSHHVARFESDEAYAGALPMV
jgi:predicted dehydrogenase